MAMMSGWAGRTRGRMIMLFWLFALMYAALIGRLAHVQYFGAERYVAMAKQQHEGDVQVPAVRGEIRDRNGVILAKSVWTWSIAVDCTKVKNLRETAEKLAALLKVKSEKLEDVLAKGGTFGWIARKVDEPLAEKIRDENLPGIFLLREPSPGQRHYPKGSLLCTLMGATGMDDQGLDGLEASYDKFLAGEPGLYHTFMDRDGWAIPGTDQGQITKPVPGRHLVLTIDETIQYVAQRELAKTCKEYHAKGGICVAIQVKTGEVLAMAVYPDFPAKDFGKVSQELRRNRALTDPYEPGSTFKTFTCAACLASGVKATDTFASAGTLSIQGWTIHNAADGFVGGIETLSDIICFSFNVGTANAGLKIGKKALGTHLDAFGFGHTTGIDLQGEEPGILPGAWPTWEPITLACVAFGQSVAVTPIQLVSAMQAIANNGVRLKPHVVKAVLNPDGTVYKEFKPEVISKPVSAYVAQETIKILRTVCIKGTGKKANVPGYRVAGKTGTAQVVSGGGYGSNYIASFLGMIPAEDPEIVMLCKIEHPQGMYYGGVVAAPVFSKVAQEAVWKLGIRPSHPEEILTAQKEGQ